MIEQTVGATGVFHVAWLLLAFPLLGSAVLLLGGKRTNAWGHWFGVVMSLASFAMGVVLFSVMLGKPGNGRSFDDHLWTWIPVNGFQAAAALRIDQLSITFVLLVTGVGSLIHIYSVGYMAHDENRRRFFAYLNLFLAGMLLLVLADNYLLLYVGWETVGLASYLLIGFWQHKPSAAVAAKKAFIVNRVGDFGFSIAIMMMYVTFGTFDFGGVFGKVSAAHPGTITAIGLLLLLGACGKSAQFPLQSWLLDAMEGPTPVSALIHAATMVTAGVYLIVRSAPIFDVSSDARLAVGIVGAITLLMGAIIGCAKDDIKKSLAGSTMSQIGYMIMAAGLGPVGYVFAIFHLVTHGFFKAGLFLGAGSVMHGMNDEVNMRHYGGLWRRMPLTFVTFGLGYLAIIGFPGLSGFWSKDKIIEAAYGSGGTSGDAFGLIAVIGVAITAFYMTRMMLMTFFGEPRWQPDAEGNMPHPHESPGTMGLPMVLLAVGSVLIGGLLSIGSAFVNWLTPVAGYAEPREHVTSLSVSLTTAVLMLVGAGIAWFMYGRRPVPATAPSGSFATVAARHDLYGDAVNEVGLMLPGQYLTRSLVYTDNRGIDGMVNGLAALVGGASGRLRRLQNGFVRTYALSMVGGAALLVAAMLLTRY